MFGLGKLFLNILIRQSRKAAIARFKQQGYSLLEMMMASAIGMVTVGATYASYAIIANQYNRISAHAEVQEAAIPTLRLLEQDVRIAGYKALDASLESNFGAITDAITITDSGNACCDSLTVVYDKSLTERVQIIYTIQTRTNPTRNALYRDVNTWDDGSSSWISSIDDALVTDYVEDFQIEGSDTDSNGDPRVVDISLILRSKEPLKKTTTYTKPSYTKGNYDLTATDAYYRQEFPTTIYVRNLRN